MNTETLSYDGQGVIMAGPPGQKFVVARTEGAGLELAPLFVAAPQLLVAAKHAHDLMKTIEQDPEANRCLMLAGFHGAWLVVTQELNDAINIAKALT